MKLKLSLIALLALSISAVSQARDDQHFFSIQQALNSPKAKEVLLPNVKLYFGRGASGIVIHKGLVSNKKTNAFNKSAEKACQIAFLSAVKTFQQRAVKSGANKVTNLISFYKKKPYKSTTQYECHDGTFVAGVALKGDIVR